MTGRLPARWLPRLARALPSAGALLLAGGLVVALVAADARGFVRSRDNSSGACLFWTRREIPWHLNEKENVSEASFSEVRAVLRSSFDTWQAVECSDLGFAERGLTSRFDVGYVSGSSDNLNLLVFRRDFCGDVVPAGHSCRANGNCANLFDCWNHPRAVIALTTTNYNRSTGVIFDSDIEFNAAGFRFVTEPPARCPRQGDPACEVHDIQNTVTHEIGHFIGFDHSPLPASTMYASALPAETIKRDLSPDDTDAICHVYPAGAPVRTCTPSGNIVVTPADDGGDGPCGCGSGGSAAGGLVLLALALLRRLGMRPFPLR